MNGLAFLLVTAWLLSCTGTEGPLPGSDSGWRNTTNAHFRIVFNSINKERTDLPPLVLKFGESGRDDVVAFLQKFPLQAIDSVEGLPERKTYRYIRNGYEGFRSIYHLGEEEDAWQAKLFCISSLVEFPGQLRHESSPVYRLTRTLYGEPTRLQKFRFVEDDQTTDTELYMAVWERGPALVTCRSIYDRERDVTISVLEFWDPDFVKGHDPIQYR